MTPPPETDWRGNPIDRQPDFDPDKPFFGPITRGQQTFFIVLAIFLAAGAIIAYFAISSSNRCWTEQCTIDRARAAAERLMSGNPH